MFNLRILRISNFILYTHIVQILENLKELNIITFNFKLLKYQQYLTLFITLVKFEYYGRFVWLLYSLWPEKCLLYSLDHKKFDR